MNATPADVEVGEVYRAVLDVKDSIAGLAADLRERPTRRDIEHLEERVELRLAGVEANAGRTDGWLTWAGRLVIAAVAGGVLAGVIDAGALMK